VIRARDEAEIGDRLSSDPWTQNQMLHTSEIRAWELRLGFIPSRTSGR
jgi:hypothetical protein